MGYGDAIKEFYKDTKKELVRFGTTPADHSDDVGNPLNMLVGEIEVQNGGLRVYMPDLDFDKSPFTLTDLETTHIKYVDIDGIPREISAASVSSLRVDKDTKSVFFYFGEYDLYEDAPDKANAYVYDDWDLESSFMYSNGTNLISASYNTAFTRASSYILDNYIFGIIGKTKKDNIRVSGRLTGNGFGGVGLSELDSPVAAIPSAVNFYAYRWVKTTSGGVLINIGLTNIDPSLLGSADSYVFIVSYDGSEVVFSALDVDTGNEVYNYVYSKALTASTVSSIFDKTTKNRMLAPAVFVQGDSMVYDVQVSHSNINTTRTSMVKPNTDYEVVVTLADYYEDIAEAGVTSESHIVPVGGSMGVRFIIGDAYKEGPVESGEKYYYIEEELVGENVKIAYPLDSASISVNEASRYIEYTPYLSAFLADGDLRKISLAYSPGEGVSYVISTVILACSSMFSVTSGQVLEVHVSGSSDGDSGS